jgi:hypothetical protein
MLHVPGQSMKRRLPILIVWFALLPGVDGFCANSPPAFDRDVKLLFNGRCVKCHGPARREGGLDLSNSSNVAEGGDSGPVIRPGSLAESLVWERVSRGDMPPDDPLTGRELEILESWIRSGAPGLPRGQAGESHEHWSFRTLAAVPLPSVRDGRRVHTTVDQFIQAALESRELALGPEADRSTLIRRVSLDLTGLPPNPADVSAFLSDPDPAAYPRMVEKFLASPQYGVHWGKRWLDVAGYADSNGFYDADSDRLLAYRYRDYVIRSLNSDKPFNRFICEQVAGDELSGFRPGVVVTPDMVELLEATHFLRNAQDGTNESDGSPLELLKDRHAVLEGTVEILGSALFGITLQCARCHDHKLEPVTQRDYYGLMAVLAPAFNPEQWVKPSERYVDAPLPEELAAFKLALKRGRATEVDRPGKIAAVQDLSAVAPDFFIPQRGDLTATGTPVPPSAIQILSDPGNPFTIRAPYPGARSTGYRLAFARWLTRPGSRPAALLARLQVNRVWQHYFGRGLSSTPANFGFSGVAPTHPELLEWLSGRFVQSGWSMKSVHRLILTSAVYRQSGELNPEFHSRDPDNDWLWRMPLRRLDAESLRDSLLAVSGDLDLQLGGRAVRTVRTESGEVLAHDRAPGARRRSVYLQQRRTQMPTFLEMFDAPSVVTNCVERNSSATPLQSLVLLNSDFMLNRAANFARRLAQDAGSDGDARVVRAFRLAYMRDPDREELRASLQFVRDQTRQYLGQSPIPQQRAWADFCHALLASNEYLYLE